MYTEIIIGLILMILLSVLATVLPAHLGPRADPLTTPEVIKPEWFFYVAFRWLKLFSGTAAVLSMGFIVFVMFAWPFIDGAIRRIRRGSEISVWVGVAGALAIIGLTVWEALVEH
jgi:ubiquinol-cytochrome c reductase cytochrome b subunit/cytochrome b6